MQALMDRTLTIGTRGSKLALWQAEWVRGEICRRFPRHPVALEIIKTQGDRILDVPLAQVGGKGLFVKEIEEALLAGRVDLAVHSMKDMPAEVPAGLAIGAVPERESPADVLIARGGGCLRDLPPGGIIGTSSLRRAAQLRHARPDLGIAPLRGNVDTRLRKLDAGELSAIVLAAAGVRRLGLEQRISETLGLGLMLPAVGQGALCIEIRSGDPWVGPMVGALDHAVSHTAVDAERAFLMRLAGGCQVPIAGHAQVQGRRLELSGMVAEPDGSALIRDRIEGPIEEAARLGVALAERLLALGADGILNKLNLPQS
jgi:hydroxymethylbilane synthase